MALLAVLGSVAHDVCAGVQCRTAATRATEVAGVLIGTCNDEMCQILFTGTSET